MSFPLGITRYAVAGMIGHVFLPDILSTELVNLPTYSVLWSANRDNNGSAQDSIHLCISRPYR